MTFEELKRMSHSDLDMILSQLLNYIPLSNSYDAYHDRWGIYPKYCINVEDSLYVQNHALNVDRNLYVNNLYSVCYGFEKDKELPWDILNVAHLIQATPRQRVEAAYLTLKKE
ncbi:hypothetical protein IAQ67_15825 [Paenibacillus peoriae]|uniref:Uncharacterized protein n=1 Tax=Paenibacillus peoriae TaxID=59893 RepID=A0A7H0Y2Q5_9BACL|nr:hypothetical protein [Paenibacillus peoriae]QNR65363.1 hypothetical protein IAQ67_15825 [Paenibacillus peoriae]